MQTSLEYKGKVQIVVNFIEKKAETDRTKIVHGFKKKKKKIN